MRNDANLRATWRSSRPMFLERLWSADACLRLPAHPVEEATVAKCLMLQEKIWSG